MSDVHQIASEFLSRYLRQEAMPVAEEILDRGLNIVLRKSNPPVFFVGFKKDGSDVWAHDEKFAKQIPESRMLEYMYRLGNDEVFPIWGTQESVK